MTGPTTTDEDALTESLPLTVEIDPAAFDEPRQLMWERLIEEYGQETIADLVKGNLSQDLTAQGMQLINILRDNRDRIAVEPNAVTPHSKWPVGRRR